MKRFKLLTAVFLITISASCFAGKSEKSKDTKRGWRESYGGDSRIADFKASSLLVADTIDSNIFYTITERSISEFKSTILDSIIVCEQNLVLEGVSKDAINFPKLKPQKILLDCEKWQSLSQNTKYLLSIHEYLPLLGIDDTSYEYSNKIFKSFQLSSSRPSPHGEALLSSAFWCQTSNFEAALESGASLFYRSKDGTGKNAIEEAVAGGCMPIIKLIVNSGVADLFKVSEIHYALINSLENVFNFYDSYFLSNDKINDERLEGINNFLEMVTYLTKQYPELVNFKSKLDSKQNFIAYRAFSKDNYPCFNESTLLHLASYYIKFKDTKIIKTSWPVFNENVNSELVDKIDNIFAKLVELGFDENSKDSCGQTASKIKTGY